MQVRGYPDILGFTSRSRTTSALKTRMDIVSKEAVTGLQSDLTLATNGRVGTAHLMRKALNDIAQSQRISNLSRTRLDLTSQAINGARNAIGGIDTRALIALEAGSLESMGTIASEAQTNLRSVMTSLGMKQGPRNLLSGVATDKPPFSGPDALIEDVRNIISTAGTAAEVEAALDTYFDDPAGGFNTRVYTGGQSAAPALRISHNETLPLDVRGNDPAIKQALRGLAVIAVTPSGSSNLSSDDAEAVMRSGLAQAAEGNSGLITLEADLGILSESLEKSDARNTAEQLSLNSAYQSLIGRDQFEAVAELKQLEVALESSYIITSRLSGLSLSNYLR